MNRKNMRSVSFVEHLEFEFNGNLFNEALLLEDVDNDGKNELVVGNVDGALFVYKGRSTKAWKSYKHDGMITCVIAGDLWNTGKNVLLSVTADGWYNVFDFDDQPEGSSVLKLTYSQLLPSNAKTALIADVDGDGQCELVTGHTDRVVFVHKWQKLEKQDHVIEKPSEKAEEDQFQSVASSMDTKPRAMSGKNRKDSRNEVDLNRLSSLDLRQQRREPTAQSNQSQVLNQEDDKEKQTLGQFLMTNTWTLTSQITSLVLYKCVGSQYLLVSQPGGNFVSLMSSEINKNQDEMESISVSEETSLFNFPLPFFSGSQTSGIPTAMTAISHKHTRHSPNKQSSLLALCKLDGNISLLDQEQILWTLPLEQNLLTLSKLDVTSDGYEEIITCAWDGSTYIIDSEKNIVNFKFHETVMAFNAGYFGMESGANLPCFVYVTFSNTIVVYWNISLRRMVPASLLTVMESKEDHRATLRQLGLMDDDVVDESKFQEFSSKCLYSTRT